MCHKCLQYGHTIKYCKGDKVCKNCGGSGHDKKECAMVTCYHCRLGHQVGNRECTQHQREQKICDIMHEMKVGRRALQIIEGTELSNISIEDGRWYVDCRADEK